jgi:signal transduction histidine kinase
MVEVHERFLMTPRPHSREPADRLDPHATPLGAEWIRASIERSPTAIGIVHGERHTLVYANVAFRDLSATSGAAAGAIIDRSITEAFNTTAARSLISLVDRARHEGMPVRARLSPEQVGAADTWQCAVWAASSPGDLAGQPDPAGPIAVEIDSSSYSAREEAMHRDLTELLLLSAIREQSRASEADAARSRSEQMRTAQDRFLAEVSHEMRTPMQAIVGHVELMRLTMDATSEQREALASIHQGTRYLAALVGDLFQYATSVAHRVEFAVTTVDVETALDAARALVAPQIVAKGVSVNITPGIKGVAVRADAVKLLQVVLNVLTNAVKFTPTGGTVTISWSEIVAPTAAWKFVAIDIADTGRGMSASELRQVFVPYVQVGERTTANPSGVGLGLAISRELARGMSGDLVVASTPGVGSVFTLMLPSA